MVCFISVVVLLLSGCGDMRDDLIPSGSDKRPTVYESVEGVDRVDGSEVGQLLADFSLQATDGNTYSKSTLLAAGQPIVLYFTMWCPICDTHMSHYITDIAPDFPNINFIIVDFVSGDSAFAADSQSSAGYSDQTVLVDDGALKTALQGAMGTTVVVDLDGIIRMNEDYKSGVRLRDILDTL